MRAVDYSYAAVYDLLTSFRDFYFTFLLLYAVLHLQFVLQIVCDFVILGEEKTS